jgi:glyoxylase-like metal-dependent hydrolase (beta-lactamase superfamily II)
MKLTFLGTRGEIDSRTRRHRMHTSLLVSFRAANVMVDCGLDWLGKLKRIDPGTIVLTHAHPDHAWGLKCGAPCPVYAPQNTWQELQHYPIKDRHVIKERTPVKICGITFEAFPVEHSTLSPTVRYRVTAGRARVFYAPDLIYIHDRNVALHGGGEEHEIAAKLRAIAAERGLEVCIAYDGMRVMMRVAGAAHRSDALRATRLIFSGVHGHLLQQERVGNARLQKDP